MPPYVGSGGSPATARVRRLKRSVIGVTRERALRRGRDGRRHPARGILTRERREGRAARATGRAGTSRAWEIRARGSHGEGDRRGDAADRCCRCGRIDRYVAAASAAFSVADQLLSVPCRLGRPRACNSRDRRLDLRAGPQSGARRWAIFRADAADRSAKRIARTSASPAGEVPRTYLRSCWSHPFARTHPGDPDHCSTGDLDESYTPRYARRIHCRATRLAPPCEGG